MYTQFTDGRATGWTRNSVGVLGVQQGWNTCSSRISLGHDKGQIQPFKPQAHRRDDTVHIEDGVVENETATMNGWNRQKYFNAVETDG